MKIEKGPMTMITEKRSRTSADFLSFSQVANLRADMYHLLTIGFLDPTRELASGLVNGSIQSDVVETVAGLKEHYHHNGGTPSILILAAEKMLNEVFTQDVESLYHELAIEYARLFIGPGPVIVSPYESIHKDAGIHASAFLMVGSAARKVLKSYQAAGLSMVDGLNEPPDHIATELEFMYYLIEKEASAWKAGAHNEARKWRCLQISFFTMHLGEWGIEFTNLVEKKTEKNFYAALSCLSSAFFHLERKSSIE